MALMRALLIASLAVLVLQSAALAESPADTFLRLARIPEYRVEREGSVTRWPSPAQRGTQAGIQAFHKVYERWPASWAEVVASGIWQTPLRSYDGEVVNPDDQRNDFAGDVYYDVSGLHPRLVFAPAPTPNGMEEMVTEFTEGATYRGLFAKFDEGMSSSFSKFLDNEKQMVQFGILSAAREMLSYHKSIFGEYPKSMAEFEASGFSPVDFNSINPLTGTTFRFDGSASDLDFKYFAPQPGKHGKPVDGCHLRHVDDSGQPPTFSFSY